MAVLLVLCFAFYAYVRAEKRIDRANDQRYLSYLQADKLRHSSDELTRVVRTYVVTGDPAYKQAFHDILDIRDGRRKAPAGYGAIFWDMALAEGQPPMLENGPAPALMDLVRASGVTEEELAKLAEAKANSDALAAREAEAMRLVELGGPEAAANRARAIAMLHDQAYHQAKAAIMQPISDFYVMQDRRTLAGVQEAERSAVAFRVAFILATLAAVLLLWRAQRELRATLGGAVAEVHAQLVRIGGGDLEPPAAARPPPPGSVLDSLAHTRERLRAMEEARRQAADQLSEKNEALARSNAELETYAYVASHDLREPLRNVTAFSTLLARRLEGRLGAEEREVLKILTDAASRMDSLVRDLLEVSRVGRGEQDAAAVDLCQLVDTALGALHVQMEAVGARVVVTDRLPTVVGDAEELYRVFLNLVDNALKYRGAEPPLVRIGCAAEGSFWRFDVRDNGIGIENGQGYEERIFGLFQRLHQRDQHGGGTGIGLAVCRKIINRHGGRIWAESAGLGRGTTFSFTLPRSPS